jgi:hypothetical protein
VTIGKLGVQLGYNHKTTTLMAKVEAKIKIRILCVMNVNIDFSWSIEIRLGTNIIFEIIARIWSFITGGYEKQSAKIKKVLSDRGISTDEFDKYDDKRMNEFLSESGIGEITEKEGESISLSLFNN